MLKIYFGDLEEAIFNTDIFFDNTYEDSWITDELSREIIKDIDKSEVIGPHIIDSPVLGSIPVEKISGGAKTLILINHDKDHVFNASTCGDNCARWILKMADTEDVTINLLHIMDFGQEEINAVILNNNTVVHSREEYITQAKKYI